MAHAAKLGTNMTGVQMSPKDTERLLDAVNEIHPDVPGDTTGLMNERAERNAEADRIGSVPIPGSAKGMLKSSFDMMRGKSPELLLDKMGERLAYERNGVRLYDAMIAKVKGLETPDDKLIGVLQHIRDEEYEHMMLVARHIETLGADPTAQTPCADVAGVLALGPLQTITDPRTNIEQCMNALLTIELTDNAAWELLIELADAGGHGHIAKDFKHALKQENDHLVKVKSAMRESLVAQVK